LVLEDHVLEPGDCDDTNDDVNPGTPEVCNDGLDNDCSGDAPECVLEGEYGSEVATATLVGGTGFAFGFAMVRLDDDGDGVSSLAVGAPAAGTLNNPTGSIFVFDLPVTESADWETSRWSAEGELASNAIGATLLATDINGDGFEDLIAGTMDGEGVFIWQGSDAGLHSDFTVLNFEEGRQFGQSLSLLNHPAGSKLVVGADDKVLLFDLENAANGESEPTLRLFGDSIGGSRTVTTGDHDGDGLEDLLISGSLEDAFIWTSAGEGGDSSISDAGYRFTGYQDTTFGLTSTFWDADDDGYSDASIPELATNGVGTIHVFLGGPDAYLERHSEQSDHHWYGGQAYGLQVQTSDSAAELIVSAPEMEYGYWFGGSIEVFEATQDGEFEPAVVFSGSTTWCGLSSIYADLDGDSIEDVALGCGGAETSGRVHFFYAPTL
jgi:hypothetical protein